MIVTLIGKINIKGIAGSYILHAMFVTQMSQDINVERTLTVAADQQQASAAPGFGRFSVEKSWFCRRK